MQRLVELVCQAGGHFAHQAQAAGMGQFGLVRLHEFLGCNKVGLRL